MMKKINLYVDMDGVQARYGFGDSVQTMERPGYFRSRACYENMMQALKMLLSDNRFSVTVLSAVFPEAHNISEKTAWLLDNGMGAAKRLFVPCGSKKGEFAEKNAVNILIDDYSANLFSWQQMGHGFHAIKFLNEKNGSNGTWKKAGGYAVSYQMSAVELYEKITAFAKAAA